MSDRPTSSRGGKRISKAINKPLNLSLSRRIRRRRTFQYKGQSLPPVVQQTPPVESNTVQENQPARYYYAPIWNPPVVTPEPDVQENTTVNETNCTNECTTQTTQGN